MLKIEIKTGGAAYRNEDGELDRSAYELRRNLKEIEEKLEYGYQAGYIMDINGNKVGNWTLEDQQEIVIYSERQGDIMAKMRVMVVKYGYAVIEAETENEAIEKAENMSDGEFDWSDPDDTQVVDDDVDFE